MIDQPESPLAGAPKFEQPIPEKPRKKSKLLLVLILLIVVGGGAIAAVMFGGLLGGGDTTEATAPGFGSPEGEVAGTEEGPYEPIEEGVAPAAPGAPAAPLANDEASIRQRCTDKFDNDIRARGQNPDDFASAREQYAQQCVDYVQQQMSGSGQPAAPAGQPAPAGQ